MIHRKDDYNPIEEVFTTLIDFWKIVLIIFTSFIWILPYLLYKGASKLLKLEIIVRKK